MIEYAITCSCKRALNLSYGFNQGYI